MRRGAGNFSIGDLERPGEPERELQAALFSRDCAYEEIAQMARELRASRGHEDSIRQLEARVGELSRELNVTIASKSWRLTRPLRRLASVVRGAG